MLACSSNLALISTSATTCLPASAASMSALTIGGVTGCAIERLLDRQHVGSAAACSMKRCTVVENESYGWWTRTSPSRRVEKMLLGVSRSPNAGGGGGNERPILERGPVDAVDLPQRREIQQPGNFDDISGRDVEFTQQQLEHALGHVVGDFQPHGGDPKRRRANSRSSACRRSSSRSSSTSKSALRVIRNA